MAIAMARSHAAVVPLTIMDEADINAWGPKTDVTLRMLRGLQAGCQTEPTLNAHFDDQQMARTLHNTIHIGIAVDTPHGLYVPVLRDVAAQSDQQLRANIETFKQHAKANDFPPSMLKGATIVLSNYGIYAGRYASPIVTPPTVAIVGFGRFYDGIVAHQGKPAVHKLLPMSLTVDHRVVTGGEEARFLKAMIEALERK